MMNVRVLTAVAIGLLGGYVSGYAVSRSRGEFAAVVGVSWGGWFPAEPVLTAAGAAVIAVFVVGLLGRLRARYAVAAGIGLVGVALLTAVAGLTAAGTSSEQQVLVGVGVGLVAVAAVIRPAGQVWFIVAMMIAMLYGARINDSVAMPKRYAEYLTTRTIPDLSDSWPLLAGLAVALVVGGITGTKERVDPDVTGRALAFGIGAPLGFAALVLWAEQASGNPAVFVAVLAVLGLVAVSFWLPRPEAVAVLTVLAVAAMLAVDPSLSFGPDRVGVAIQVGLMVAAALAGTVWRYPVLGIGLCAGVVLCGLLPVVLDSTTGTELAFRFLLPIAAGFGVGTCLPVAPATVLALSVVPVLASLFDSLRSSLSSGTGTSFGWTAYVPDTYSPTLDRKTPTLIAAAVILGCAALVFRHQRSARQQDPPPDAAV
ncbi:hypothetical protein ACFO5K_22235 [Nocardia halotolerans]|uniref:Uncharacterized protein n=1 Tax=Nocardia halotolerans TaxID=1755878 RepID=A0ABV8VN29_9NOCA